jgi:hypothetical protein
MIKSTYSLQIRQAQRAEQLLPRLQLANPWAVA